MILHSILFPSGFPLLRRIYLDDPGAAVIPAPIDATWIRTAGSGAGGFKDDAAGWGGGAAYAFASGACAGGDLFSVQVGDTRHSRTSANDVLGDSWVKRPDTSVLIYADRGRPNGAAGTAANSTGSTKRTGSAGSGSAGGASAGDDADSFPLGFGGRGASPLVAAYYGGGGGYAAGAYKYPTFPAADGLICIEFYAYDPGLG